MFTSWIVVNREYEETKLLTHGQFVSKFVNDRRKRCWKQGKCGFTIGQFIWVSPIIGKLYYMRMLFTVEKGCYDDLKTIEGFKHKT